MNPPRATLADLMLTACDVVIFHLLMGNTAPDSTAAGGEKWFAVLACVSLLFPMTSSNTLICTSNDRSRHLLTIFFVGRHSPVTSARRRNETSTTVKVTARYCSSNLLCYSVSFLNSAELSSSRHTQMHHLTRFTAKWEGLIFLVMKGFTNN